MWIRPTATEVFWPFTVDDWVNLLLILSMQLSLLQNLEKSHFCHIRQGRLVQNISVTLDEVESWQTVDRTSAGLGTGSP